MSNIAVKPHTIPNLNDRVFHSQGATLDMMEVQKQSELAHGSDLTLLNTVLRIAKEHGVSSGIAVDLGSGTGAAATKPLLNLQTWQVYAVDAFKPSLDELDKSIPSDQRSRLVLLNNDFRNMTLPDKIDLVIANNSLCFVPKRDLIAVMNALSQNQRSGAIFAATFWGEKDVRREDSALSTLSSEEVQQLFNRNYEILSFDSAEGDGKNLNDKMVHWHVISVIAKKREF